MWLCLMYVVSFEKGTLHAIPHSFIETNYCFRQSRGDMHNEDVPLVSNVIPIFVAVYCYWMPKFRGILAAA